MGFSVKSVTKAVKKVTKQVAGGAKAFAKNPTSLEGIEAGVGLMGIPFTMGSSLALTSEAGRGVEKRHAKEEEQRAAQREAELVEENKKQYGWGSMAEVIQARKKKQQELEERGETQASGLAGLIGKGKTLG